MNFGAKIIGTFASAYFDNEGLNSKAEFDMCCLGFGGSTGESFGGMYSVIYSGDFVSFFYSSS